MPQILLSKQDKKIVKDALWDNNPITFQVLGICSALAVTVQLGSTLVMCAALTTVLAMSNTIISLLRDLIPSKIRIIVQLSIISTLVILAQPTPEPNPKTTDSPNVYPRSSIKSAAPKIAQLTAISGKKIPKAT